LSEGDTSSVITHSESICNTSFTIKALLVGQKMFIKYTLKLYYILFNMEYIIKSKQNFKAAKCRIFMHSLPLVGLGLQQVCSLSFLKSYIMYLQFL